MGMGCKEYFPLHGVELAEIERSGSSGLAQSKPESRLGSSGSCHVLAAGDHEAHPEPWVCRQHSGGLG